MWDAVKALLSAIPIIHKWFFKKDRYKEEVEEKSKVDKEHDANNEKTDKRPSGDFWNDRDL